MSASNKIEKRWSEDREHARPFRILIADRDSMSSDLLANALTGGMECLASAIPSNDLIQAIAAEEADMVVVGAEINHKGLNGLDLVEAINRAHPDLAIVVLLNRSTHESVVSAFRCGAHGVFVRERPVKEFLESVEHVRRGFIWAGGAEAQYLLDAFRSIPVSNFSRIDELPALTAREKEVIRSAARGKTNKAIAAELGLSVHTVKNYLFRAFDKLGVSNRMELLFSLTLRRLDLDGSAGEPHRAALDENP